MVATSVVVFPLSASAAQITTINTTEQNDFVLEPGKVEVFLNPGETVVRNVNVSNRIGRNVRFSVGVEDFIGSQDPERPVILLGEDKSPYSFKDNLKPDTREFALDFGQRISIPVTISVPPDASPGGYYTSVVISNQPDKDLNVGSSTEAVAQNKIISRVGVLFFIRVNGNVSESGNLEDFRIEKPEGLIRQSGPIKFQILFNNTGSVHLVPYGTITIKNLFGQKVADIPVDAYFALPTSMRYRPVEWQKKVLLGRYTATLELNRGYGNIIDTKKLAFWVIPWKILAVVFGGFLIGIGLLYYILTRFEFKRKK